MKTMAAACAALMLTGCAGSDLYERTRLDVTKAYEVIDKSTDLAGETKELLGKAAGSDDEIAGMEWLTFIDLVRMKLVERGLIEAEEPDGESGSE